MICLWVVELLSPTCPGLVWVVILLHQLCLCQPYYCYVSLILLVWRIGFGVTGLELRSVDSDSSGLRLVDSGKPVVDIIPNSKDRFMERPPMKTVQP
jgi:hypothetical protein